MRELWNKDFDILRFIISVYLRDFDSDSYGRDQKQQAEDIARTITIHNKGILNSFVNQAANASKPFNT